METLRMKEESLAWAQWQEILNQCMQRGTQFVDDSFPAAPRSLYYPGGGGGAEQPAARWLRPRQIHVDAEAAHLPWAVFRHPRPSDISQGILITCKLFICFCINVVFIYLQQVY